MGSKEKNITKSLLGRTTKLFSTGANIVGQELSARLIKSIKKGSQAIPMATRIKQAQHLVNSLGDLRGAAMKAGQLLSLEMSDLLPKEIVEILEQLHDQGHYMPYETVEKILIKEFGQDGFNQVQELSRTPIASASIGQVHSAVIQGEKVAIKVQFPGVAKSIDSDLAVLKRVINSLLVVFGKKNIAFDQVFEEIRSGLKKEVDYSREAKSVDKFGEIFADDSRYVIPKVYHSHSTKRVLTLSFEEGERLRAWMDKPNKTDQEKQQFGDLIINLLIKEFFETGHMQTDPNYGNFFYRPDTNQLVLLDFGATKYYAKTFRNDLIKVMNAAYQSREDDLCELAYILGLLDERESDSVKEQFLILMDLIVHMFQPQNQPFLFSDDDYLAEVRTTTLELIKAVHFSAPAKNLIFLNRKLGGMFHLLKEVGVSLDMQPYWSRVTVPM